MKNLSERNSAIIALRKSGMTLEEISNVYGVTRSRVQQICADEQKLKNDELRQFPQRTRLALNRAGIFTKYDLWKYMQSKDLYALRGIGRLSVMQIYDVMSGENVS